MIEKLPECLVSRYLHRCFSHWLPQFSEIFNPDLHACESVIMLAVITLVINPKFVVPTVTTTAGSNKKEQDMVGGEPLRINAHATRLLPLSKLH